MQPTGNNITFNDPKRRSVVYLLELRHGTDRQRIRSEITELILTPKNVRLRRDALALEEMIADIKNILTKQTKDFNAGRNRLRMWLACFIALFGGVVEGNMSDADLLLLWEAVREYAPRDMSVMFKGSDLGTLQYCECFQSRRC